MPTTSQALVVLFISFAFTQALGDLFTSAEYPFKKDSAHQFRMPFSPTTGSMLGYIIQINYLENATVAELDPVVLQLRGQNYSFGVQHSFNTTSSFSYTQSNLIDPCAYPQALQGGAAIAFTKGYTDATRGKLTVVMWSGDPLTKRKATNGGEYSLGCFFTGCSHYMYIEPDTSLEDFSLEITLHLSSSMDTKLVVAGGPDSCPTQWSEGALHMESTLPADKDSVIRLEKGFKKIWLLFISEESTSQVTISYKVFNATAVEPSSQLSPSYQPESSTRPESSSQPESSTRPESSSTQPKSSSTEGGQGLLWVWVLISVGGAVLLVGLIVIFVVRKKRTGYIQVEN